MENQKDVTSVRIKRCIERRTGAVKAVFAYRINIAESTIEYGVSKCHPNDVYDRHVGYGLARKDLETNMKSIGVLPVKGFFMAVIKSQIGTVFRDSVTKHIYDELESLTNDPFMRAPTEVFRSMFAAEGFKWRQFS